MDSVDQLCEELLHLQGTQIQCATSDMEGKHDLDVMANGEEHGQTLLHIFYLKKTCIFKNVASIFFAIFKYMGV